MNQIFACFTFLLIFAFAKTEAQRLEYDIIWLGKVGKLHIHKTINEDTQQIETNSEVKLPFYKLNWITTASFKNGRLMASNYRQLLNDKKREYTEISMTSDSTWKMTNDLGHHSFIDIKNPFFVSRLYFEEPLKEQFVFSERYAQPLELINYGNGHYQLLLPDGNTCDYFYEDGKCKKVKAKNGKEPSN